MVTIRRKPATPGEILKAHYLEPRGITVTALAHALGCSRKHISNIVHEKASMEASIATRLAAVLDTTPQFWLNLQNAVDIYRADQENDTWRPREVFPFHAPENSIRI